MNTQDVLQMLTFDQAKVPPEDRELLSKIGVKAYLELKARK